MTGRVPRPLSRRMVNGLAVLNLHGREMKRGAGATGGVIQAIEAVSVQHGAL